MNVQRYWQPYWQRYWQHWRQHLSLRGRLLIGILLPMALLIGLNTVSLYHQAREAADIAYDRTLLATAKSLGDLLEVVGSGAEARLHSNVLYSALEPFEADNRSRLYYKVSGFRGEMVSGFADLPSWHGRLPDRSVYAALVDFYDDRYRDQPVRVAVLLQPVAGREGLGVATIQVAETLELRHTLARRILIQTIWQQALLLAVIAWVVIWVVHFATRPVRQLSQTLQQRSDADLTPIASPDAPRELQPLIDATNTMMGRLAQLLEHQKRFVRDASHQLRTPLAVLKTQVQSARRGDLDAAQALAEIEHTVDGATELANQMLALAKVEQLRQQGDPPPTEWSELVRTVALDLSVLIGERQLDFSIETTPATVRAHAWALRELTRNLLHNAVKHAPPGSELTVRLVSDGHIDGHIAALTITDAGPGIAPELRERLFQPFATGRRHAGTGSGAPADLRHGAGLGLAICQEIVQSLGGTLQLDNRESHGRVLGLEATVRLPLAG